MRHSLKAKDVETIAAPISSGAAESDLPPFSNGAVLAGKYQVEETIAHGGIGVVVVARHLALHQRVAIKYLKTNALSNPVIVERFVREARLAAQLTSEHVVRVHDVGTLPNGGPYMVMEYLVGEDLGRTIRSGPLPIERAVDYVLQACDALAEAHALRIVHRDIKPENMFLAQRAANTALLKIIDFGISKVSPRRGEMAHWATETAATERFGTPLYMSPEQLRSTSNVDTRTDIWSLGVVLYELITGGLPFKGDGLPQVCTSVLTDSPAPMTELRPDAPPRLEAIVFKCLEKDANRRYRNVAELAQDLAAFGPPNSMARVERIAEIVRRGGDSIRPPPPAPWPARTRLAGDRPVGDRRVTTIKVRRARIGAGPAVVAGIAGLACAGLLITGFVRGQSGVPGAPARSSVPPSAPVSAPPTDPDRDGVSAKATAATPNPATPNAAMPNAATPNAATPNAATTAIVVVAGSVAPPPTDRVESSMPAAIPPPRAHAIVGKARAPAAATAKAAPAIAINRRSQFGERE